MQPAPERDEREARFGEVFPSAKRLILEEWPTLDRDALDATKGELDPLVTLVAAHADRTKVVTRKLLLELFDLAQRERSSAATNGKAHAAERPKIELPPMDDVIAAIRRLETFAADEAKRVSDQVVPAAETRVKKNIWISLAFALGLGLILGLWLNGGRRR